MFLCATITVVDEADKMEEVGEFTMLCWVMDVSGDDRPSLGWKIFF